MAVKILLAWKQQVREQRNAIEICCQRKVTKFGDVGFNISKCYECLRLARVLFAPPPPPSPRLNRINYKLINYWCIFINIAD